MNKILKALILLVFITNCGHLFAQDTAYVSFENARTYTEEADSLMQYLQLHSPNGILYDRVCPIAQLTDTNAYDTTDFDYLVQAYSELLPPMLVFFTNMLALEGHRGQVPHIGTRTLC